MAKNFVGYEFLRQTLQTGALPLERPAAIYPVTKITAMTDYLQVPAHVGPASGDPLVHFMFALKHEGVQMQSAILALKHISGGDLASAFRASPTSAYLRQACYLWELANGEELQDLPAAQGSYVSLFDPKEFLTDKPQRDERGQRWRVEFNGIGSPNYCVAVRRTPRLEELLKLKILDATRTFVAALDPVVLDRAVQWSYLSETQGSYEIERERPTDSKRVAFAKLLAHAHEPEPITEEYLVTLQNLTVNSPLVAAFEFRANQNWLRNSLPGALGVTYLPPTPGDLMPIMEGVMALANNAKDSDVDPVVLGAVASFAFVFAHPFMDGNGRLSRFLFHRVACARGDLPNGMVLPVSVAMKRHEKKYLDALQSFSKPAREAWDVTWIDGDRFDSEFKGPVELYRYWDATLCAEFGLEMAQEALEKDLRGESEFLLKFDRAYKSVNDVIDMSNDDLTNLVRFAVMNGGKLSNNRLKQFIAKGHPQEQLDLAQRAIDEAYQVDDDSGPAP